MPKGGSRGEWATEQAVAQAWALWRDGMSIRAIATAVGTTRHAIVGYSHRHHWPPHPHPPVGGRRKAPDGAQPVAAPKLLRPRKATPAPRQPSPGGISLGACNPLPLAVPTPRFAGCQWIEPSCERRPWTMCGAPVWRGAWCREHWHRVYHRSARQELVPA